MSYQTEIEDPRSDGEMLVIVNPKVRATNFTNITGNIWRTSFSLGYIIGVAIFGVDQDVATDSEAPASGEYGFDNELKYLYIYSVTDPNDSFIVTSYEIYLSTLELTFSREPFIDDVLVEWEPVISILPVFQQSNADALFGYAPIKSTQFQALNGEGFFNPHLYDSSFNKAPVSVYHSPTNDFTSLKNIFNGYVTAFSFDADTISFTLSDSFAKLDNLYDRSVIAYDTTEFPLLDPQANNGDSPWYIRKVYGMIDGYRSVNVDYNNMATTSNNRSWVAKVNDGATDNGTIEVEIDSMAANTTFRTYFLTTPKVMPGDQIYFNHAIGPNYSVTVGAVNYALKYIDHSAVSRTISFGDSIVRYFIGWVIIIDEDNTEFSLELNGLWFPDDSMGATGKGMGFNLAPGFESSIGFPNSPFDPSIHIVACRVYGSGDIPSYEVLSGPITTTSDFGGVFSNAAGIAYDILKTAGLSANEVDEQSFADLIPSSKNIGLSIPFTFDGTLPTYKDALVKIQQSTLYNIQTNDANNYAGVGISLPDLITGTPPEINNQEFDQFKYTHDYLDLYALTQVRFQIPEQFNPGAYLTKGASTISILNAACVYLHGVSPQKTFKIDSLLYLFDEATDLAGKVSSIVGERRGQYSLTVPVSYITEEIGNNKTIIRDSLPGNSYVYGSEKSATAKIIEINKSTSGVTLTLDDQRGINENSDYWL